MRKVKASSIAPSFTVKLSRPIKLFAWAFLAVNALVPAAGAAVITPVLSDFQLTNTSFTDGTVVIAPDGLSFVLTGGNSGALLAGTTDFTTVASNSGLVEFQYSYASLDAPGLDDQGVPFDAAGYLAGNLQTLLADADGVSGSASFSVSAGQTYGWWVSTDDNQGEPGILTVSFSPAATATPEPAGFALAFSGLAFAAITQRRLARPARRQKDKQI